MKSASPIKFSAHWAAFCLILGGLVVPPATQIYADVTVTDKLRLEVAPSSATFLEFRSNGIIIGRSTDTSSHLLPADLEDSGSLFLWNPSGGQFRAGAFYESNLSVIGDYSSAIGSHSMARGHYSFAGGDCSQAWGEASLAFGLNAFAYGAGAINFGSGAASGFSATALGKSTFAMGDFSTALGGTTQAGAFACTAVGYMNVGGGDPWEWIPTDPLFEIGNGMVINDWQDVWCNALTVYKNGSATFQGVVHGAPGGGIPMLP